MKRLGLFISLCNSSKTSLHPTVGVLLLNRNLETDVLMKMNLSMADYHIDTDSITKSVSLWMYFVSLTIYIQHIFS